MDGNEIKNARQLSGYTQVEVSKATGIAQSTRSEERRVGKECM